MATKSVRKAANATQQSQPINYHTNIGFWRGRLLSFLAALQGVAYTFRTQPNIWIEVAALIVVAAAGLWFGISALEWALLGFTIAVIMALEAVNTAIEAVVDLVSPQYHPLAKIAKDTAAGAMILAVLGSMIVAACIFGPRLWALLR
jgi:diacylglycerol kinase (ATP)